MHDMWR